MTPIMLKHNDKQETKAESPGKGNSTVERESKCQVSKVSFKNLTAAFVNAAEGQGQPYSPGIMTRASSFTCSSLLHVQTKVAKPLED